MLHSHNLRGEDSVDGRAVRTAPPTVPEPWATTPEGPQTSPSLFHLRSPFAAGTRFSLTPGQGPGQGTHGAGYATQLHIAWDFVAKSEASFLTPVYALGAGTVIDVRNAVPDGDPSQLSDDGTHGSGGIGNFITIRYDNLGSEPIYVSYFHLAQDSVPLAKGGVVSAGTLVGLIGNTGARDGTHLHVNIGLSKVSFGGNWIADGTWNQALVDRIVFQDFGGSSPYTSTTDVDGALVAWSGESGADNRVGGSQNDYLRGLSGNDFLTGGAGDDTLNGGADSDNLDGGFGIDTLIGSGGGDTYHLGLRRGYDIIDDRGGGGSDTIYIYGGGEVLSASQIVTEAIGGSDYMITVYSQDGHDILARFKIRQMGSGEGAIEELVVLGADESRTNLPFPPIRLSERFAADTQSNPYTWNLFGYGGGSNEPETPSTFTWSGDDDEDLFLGGGGNDVVRGRNGVDALSGGGGNDTLLGEGDADALNGGDGDDFLIDDDPDHLSFDNLAGGAGDDILVFYGAPGGTHDVGDGGSGHDLAYVDISDSERNWRLVESDGEIEIRLKSGSSEGRIELDDFEVVAVIFGDGDDSAHTGDQQAYLEGGDGDDQLTTEGEDDYLDGGDGDDKLDAGVGRDWLDGGDGDDRATIDLSGENGDLTYSADEALSGDGFTFANGTHVRNVEWVELITGSGDDRIWLLGGDEVSTGSGDDTLTVSGGGETRFNGGGGTDRLIADFAWASSHVRTAIDGGDRIFYLGSSHLSSNDWTRADSVEQFDIRGSQYDDRLYAGDGDDELDGRSGDDRLLGGGGIDVLRGQDGADELFGEDGADTLNGDAGADVLDGEAGDDVLYGGEGDDVIRGGLGQDQSYGQGGADTWMFGPQDSLIGSYDVILDFTSGIDRLDLGGLYTGVLWLSTTTDGVSTWLHGDLQGDGVWDFLVMASGSTLNGNDILIGQLGAAPIGLAMYGHAGQEVLTAGRGNDALYGQDGDDVLIGGAGADVLNGGAGIDTADYSGAAAGVRAQLNSNASSNDGDGGTDTFSSIENLTGSAFNDTLIGDGMANVLRGGLGADTLLGLGGNDVLWGGSGALNTLQGGLGDDRYVLEAADSIVENLGEGIDTVEARIAVYTLATNVENLVFGGTGAFTGTGNALANTLTGGAGDDNLRGRGGADVLNGGLGADTVDYTLAAAGVVARLDLMRATNDGDGAADTFTGVENLTGSIYNDLLIGDAGNNVLMGGIGTDTLLGFGGNDVLWGGSGGGNNQLQGGQGDDWYVLDAFDTCVEVAGEGIDTVEARIGSYTLGNNIENLLYTGPGKFVGSGNALNNTITGGAQNDILKGGGGNDVINGGLGSDEVQFRGSKAQYTVTVEGSGYRIVDSVAGRDGSTLVSSIEVLRFLTGNTTTALTYAASATSGDGKAPEPQVSPIIDDQPIVLPALHDKAFDDAPLVLPGPEADKMLLRELFVLDHGGAADAPHGLTARPDWIPDAVAPSDWM